MIKKCENCAHWHSTLETGTSAGECRAHPAKVFPVPTNRGIGWMTVFPVLQANHFCGEFENKLSVVSK